MRRSHPLSRLAARWLALGLLAAATAGAQTAATAGTAKQLQADYAVPEAPALKMLEVDESKLLRPATVRSLTAQLSSATGDFDFIPRALAVEFSPGLLVNGEQLSIAEYRRNPLWYRLRLSLATKRGDGENARSQVAFGLRVALQDDSDLRTNRAFETAILGLARWQRDSLREAQLVQTQVLRIPVTREPTAEERKQIDSVVAVRKLELTARRALGIADTATPTPEQQARLDREVGQLLSARASTARELVAAVKRAREQALWNASVLDVAVGVVSSTRDSSGRKPRLDGVAGWLTKGWGFMPHAQLLLGARGAYQRDSVDAEATELRATGDAALRLYVGSNAYKVLGEVQATGQAASAPKWLGNVGGELQLSDMLWLTASAGWQATGPLGNGRLVSSLKLKLNPPNR